MSHSSYEKIGRGDIYNNEQPLKLLANSHITNLPNPSLVFFLTILQFPVKWVNLSLFSSIFLDRRWKLGKNMKKMANLAINLCKKMWKRWVDLSSSCQTPISGLLIGKNSDTRKVKYPLSMSNGGKISSIQVHAKIHVQGR